MKKPVVAYVGLTHLGLVYAASAAEKGFRTIAFDPDAALVASIAAGKLPVNEPGLAEIYRRKRRQFTFSSDAGAISLADIVYISADVPTNDAGESDLARTRALIATAASQLRRNAVLVVLCQVPPAFTRNLDLQEKRLFYQVETLVFGQAVARARAPERFIVGCADPARKLPAPYAAHLAAWRCPVMRMRYESAELTKIAINCCLVASVSTANTLAELCERIGADWSEIAPALKLDRRIGAHAYLSPGLGIAGGNLERDLATVMRLAAAHGTDADVVGAWVKNSAHRRNWAALTLRKFLLERKPDALIAVWGLAYKENTHSVKNSPSLATISQLKGAKLITHDPVVPSATAKEPLEAARGADALMILTPWPQYRAISPASIAKAMRGRIVLDPYGVLDRAKSRAAGLQVHALGRAPDA